MSAPDLLPMSIQERHDWSLSVVRLAYGNEDDGYCFRLRRDLEDIGMSIALGGGARRRTGTLPEQNRRRAIVLGMIQSWRRSRLVR